MEALGDSNSFKRKATLLYKTGSNFSVHSPLRYHSPLIRRSPTPPKSLKKKQSVSPSRDSYFLSTFGARRMSLTLPKTQYVPEQSYCNFSRDIMQFSRQHEIEGVLFSNKQITPHTYRFEQANGSQKKHPLYTVPKKNSKHRRGQSIDSYTIIRLNTSLQRRT